MNRSLFVLAICLVVIGCDASDPDALAPFGLVSPTETELTRTETELSWSVDEPAPQYQIEVVRSLGGQTDTTWTNVSELGYAQRFGPGAFAWRVRTVRGVDIGPWSETARFRFDRAVVPVSMSWFLSTTGLQPNRDYDDTQISPFGIQQITTASRSIDSLGLDLSLVTSARFDRLEGRLSTPEGATLDAFESYRVRTLTGTPVGSPVAELSPAPPALESGLTILDSQVPDAVFDGTGVRYRLRVRTGNTLPPQALHTFVVEGTATLALDVNG